MGIQEIGRIFSKCVNTGASRVARYAEACGQPSILMTKPVKNLHINPLEIASDTVGDKLVLSIDKTLNPDFLKSLLEIKGTPLEKITQIKDKMLTLMGYDSSLVKVENRPYMVLSDFVMKICYDTGIVGINAESIKNFSDIQIIQL